MVTNRSEIGLLEAKLKDVLDFVQRIKMTQAPVSTEAVSEFECLIDLGLSNFEKKFVDEQCSAVETAAWSLQN